MKRSLVILFFVSVSVSIDSLVSFFPFFWLFGEERSLVGVSIVVLVLEMNCNSA